MAGFATEDQYLQAITNGQKFDATFTKNFNPTTAAVANEWHTFFRGGGNPPADALFNTGTNLLFQAIRDNTTSAGALQHGGNVQASNFYKYLAAAHVFTAAATVVPCTVALIDVIGFYRVTSVTTTSAQATTNTLGMSDTFSADDTTDICTYTSTVNIPSNILTGTRVRLTTTTTLPAGLSLATDYYVIRVSDTTFKLATSYANAIAGTQIDITTTGTGTHTISWLLPRYTNGSGVNAIMFNSNATPLGAATPNLSFPDYTNSSQVTGRSTPTVLPIGKTAASNSIVLYSGSGAGKYNPMMPLQSGDSGIAQINSIQNSTSYLSGEYCVALYREIGRFPLSTLGLATERNFKFEYPSLPRIYDGAALYFLLGSGVATPANSAISGALTFVWN